ncbi:DapH/DapD/GlmU-related protein [Formosa haliotis]|uniref:DapH/DapD/GlmU-related protein n=1 Tax=Formosa haliotis TaxID=1555194 RepID=UPI000826B25F|nr:DapH/DapD/GlmU-related protein [Formosa haliotis]
MKKIAPIILFVYNRADHTLKTLEALSKNALADQSILYIFADGPKSDASTTDLNKIKETRAVLKQKQWCGTVNVIESDTNKGLAESIIFGVSDIVTKYGKVIVLEDDIVTSPGFLQYMNDALNFYENEDEVMHISGFMYPHKMNLPETFFFNVPLCWGWATWDRAWKYFQKDTDKLLKFATQGDNWQLINKFGGDFLGSQLKLNKLGRMNTWFIKWHISVLMKKGYTLYPSISLVENIGFDNTGVHNGSTDKFKQFRLSDNIKVKDITFLENKDAEEIIKQFYGIKNELQPSNFEILKRKLKFKKLIDKLFFKFFPEVRHQLNKQQQPFSGKHNTYLGIKTKIYPPYALSEVLVGDYTYLAQNSLISNAIIGKFCSIGPNLVCGYGIHPTKGVSTAPMFYSTMKQNGMTLCDRDKINERETIFIGNDVLIGMNVTILDGVKIGDGAIIGAGSVVSKDIPPYAIAVGSPIKVIKYRFSDQTIRELQRLKWWDLPDDQLGIIEKNFWNIDNLISELKIN